MKADKIIRWLTAASGLLTAVLAFERALEHAATTPEETSALHAAGIALTATIAAVGSVIAVLRSNGGAK